VSFEAPDGWDELPRERVARLRGFDAWRSGDPETWIKRFSPDCEFRSFVSDLEGEVYRGHDGLREFLRAQSEVWAEIHMVAERGWRRGRMIMVAGHLATRARHSGVEVDLPIVFLAERERDGRTRWAAQFESLGAAIAAAGERSPATP
jgi:ketosteroid isomerase-like protein